MQLVVGDKYVLTTASHVLQSLKGLHKVYILPKEDLCDGSISVLSTLVHIETLLISKIKHPTQAETLAKGLSNLKEIFIESEDINLILTFVRHSPKLAILYIFVQYDNYLYPQKNLNNLNVITLNKLPDACPLTIYIHRNLYLIYNLSVEIKRIESYPLKNPAVLDSIIGCGYVDLY